MVSYRVTSIDPFFMTIFRINFKRFLGNCPPTPPLTQVRSKVREGVGAQFPRHLN